MVKRPEEEVGKANNAGIRDGDSLLWIETLSWAVWGSGDLQSSGRDSQKETSRDRDRFPR